MIKGHDVKPSLLERNMHYVLLLMMMGLIIFAAVFVYASITKQARQVPVIEESSKAAAKPLPDYMIKTLKPDELEQLKP